MVFDLIQEELQIQVNRARRFIIDCLENTRLEYDSEAESDEINSFMDSSNSNNEVEKWKIKFILFNNYFILFIIYAGILTKKNTQLSILSYFILIVNNLFFLINLL